MEILDKEKMNNEMLALTLETLVAVLSGNDDELGSGEEDELGERLAEVGGRRLEMILSLFVVNAEEANIHARTTDHCRTIRCHNKTVS